MTDSSLLFVYGSLLTGTGLPGLDLKVRRACAPVGRARIAARLYDLGRYPGAVPTDQPREQVLGVLVEVRDLALWTTLDRYEAYDEQRPTNSEFVRRLTSAHLLATQDSVTCWVYYYNRQTTHRARIRSGDYLAYRQRARTTQGPCNCNHS